MPLLDELLDRSTLLARIHDPASPRPPFPYPGPRWDVLLLVDSGPSRELDAAIQAAERLNDPVAPWGRQRLAAHRRIPGETPSQQS